MIKKIIKHSLAIIYKIANSLLSKVEPLFFSDSFKDGHIPVFIIGPPRSGSTLFYQLMINRFDFGYLTNFHCLLYGFPAILQFFIGKFLRKFPNSSYASIHGQVQGIWAPSECGDFWYRWFRRFPTYTSIDDINLDDLQSLRRVIIGLTQTFKKPILFKNMLCALRLRPLAAIFPEALFIITRRNTLYNAQSLLLTRQRVFGNLEEWWSMEPPNIEELRNLEPEKQVVRQVEEIHSLIERDAEIIGNGKFLFVEYENLCTDAHDVLNQVHLFLTRHNVNIEIKGEVPDTFKLNEEIRIAPQVFERIKKAINGNL